jgi:hypothetical protein
MSPKSVEAPAKKPAKKRRPYVRRVSARFMDRQELASILAVHVETVKRREGKVHGWPTPVRVGNKAILYERSDVERFLRNATNVIRPLKEAQ